MDSKPTCKLNVQGNIWDVIHGVSGTLRRMGLCDKADEFETRALHANNHNDVCRLIGDYVEVNLYGKKEN